MLVASYVSDVKASFMPPIKEVTSTEHYHSVLADQRPATGDQQDSTRIAGLSLVRRRRACSARPKSKSKSMVVAPCVRSQDCMWSWSWIMMAICACASM